jgi:hypothetical protein
MTGADGESIRDAGADALDEVDDDVVREFVGLADALFTAPADGGVVAVVDRVVQSALAVVPGAQMVSVTLRCADDENFTTVAASHELAERADALQAEEDDGPARTATLREGLGVALASDLLGEDRWPKAGPRLHHELGLRAVLATGMFPGGDPPRFGALNFYSRDGGGLDGADRDHALVLAAHAATAISAAKGRRASDLREAQLGEALRSRDVIGQAKGILMERRGYDAEQAFDVLRRTSQELNVKLREVAETLVSRRAEL